MTEVTRADGEGHERRRPGWLLGEGGAIPEVTGSLAGGGGRRWHPRVAPRR